MIRCRILVRLRRSEQLRLAERMKGCDLVITGLILITPAIRLLLTSRSAQRETPS